MYFKRIVVAMQHGAAVAVSKKITNQKTEQSNNDQKTQNPRRRKQQLR